MRALLCVVVIAWACGACGKKAAGPADGSAAPTAEECRAAIANLNRLQAGAAADTDIDECLRLPRAAVLCLGRAKTEADVQSCAQAHSGARFGKGGSGRAEPIGGEVGADQCMAAATAAKKLRPEIQQSIDDLVDECVRSAVKGDVSCLLAAKTPDEAKKCGLFGLE